MIRTVISLEEDTKRWLDRQARQEGVPASRLVRKAIDLLRRNAALESLPFDQLLQRTSGSWKRGDGLAYQRKMRGEWGRSE